MGPQPWSPPTEQFCHQAYFYKHGSEFFPAIERFVREGVHAGDEVLVVLGASKLASLRSALGSDATSVKFADMDLVGGNPARIIPFWRAFLDELAPGQRARGVGEPISSRRKGPELAECQVHESLLNVAFADGPPFWLVCPYDTAALDDAVLDEARRAHAFVSDGHPPVVSEGHLGVDSARQAMGKELPPAPADARQLNVDATSVSWARHAVRAHAVGFGLSRPAADDFALAVHEVIANSLQHGGGRAELSIWTEVEALICEVRDFGRFHEPLAGRQRPGDTSAAGRGLWMANQLCNLVQIRSVANGTVVRLHASRPATQS